MITIPKHIKYVVPLICCGLASNSLLAQPVLEEVLVTAQKREQGAQDVPVALTAISAEAIENLGLQASVDLVRVVPSLTVTEGADKPSSAFSIRGIGTNVFGAGIEQAVAMLIDDVAVIQQGQAINNLVGIERVEVLRGPQSTLFGKAASAGVISVVTKAPTEEFEGVVELTAADDDELRVISELSGPIAEDLRYRLTAHWSERDGYIENLTPGVADQNGEDTQGVRAKLQWDINDSISSVLTAYYSEEESVCCVRTFRELDPNARAFVIPPMGPFPGFPGVAGISEGITPGEDNFTVRTDTPPDSKTEGDGANLRFNVGFGEFSLISISAYDHWRYSNQQDTDLGDLDLQGEVPIFMGEGGFISDSEREVTFVSQELRLLSPSYDNYDYLLGFYYSDSKVDRSFFRDIPIAFANETSTSGVENIALFGQLNWHFTKRLRSSLGLRYFYEEISAEFDNRLLPVTNVISASSSDNDLVGKASLEYFVADDVMLFSSYTRGYKGAAFDVSTGFDQTRADNPVAPELSDSYEIGMKSTWWNQRLQLNLVAFHTDYDDFQVQNIQFADDLTTSFELSNVGTLQTRGIELESVALLSDALAFTFNAAYVDATVNDFNGASCYTGQTAAEGCVNGTQNIDGGTLPNSPEWKFTAMLDYRKQLDSMPFDLFANLLYTWQDDIRFGIDQHPDLVQESYGISNLRLGVTDKGGRYEITAFVNNLFDKAYAGDMLDASPLFGGTTDVALLQVLPRNAQRYSGVKARFNF